MNAFYPGWHFDPITSFLTSLAWVIILKVATEFIRAKFEHQYETAYRESLERISHLCEQLYQETVKTINERLCCQHQKLCAVGNRVAGLTARELAIYRGIFEEFMHTPGNMPAAVKKIVKQWDADATRANHRHMLPLDPPEEETEELTALMKGK